MPTPANSFDDLNSDNMSRSTVRNDIIFKPALRCIYCGKRDVKLSREHILPYSLNGGWIMHEASCADCAKITSKFENTVTRKMYFELRTKENFQTRDKKTRPKQFPITVKKYDGTKRVVQVDVAKYPTIYPIVHLPSPGILTNKKPSNRSPEGLRLSIIANQEEIDSLTEEYQANEFSLSSNFLLERFLKNVSENSSWHNCWPFC